MNRTPSELIKEESACRPAISETSAALYRIAESLSSLIDEYRKTSVQGDLAPSGKYALTVKEAVSYFGIGENRMRSLIKDYPDAEYLLWVGTKALIKREQFTDYLNETNIL